MSTVKTIIVAPGKQTVRIMKLDYVSDLPNKGDGI